MTLGEPVEGQIVCKHGLKEFLVGIRGGKVFEVWADHYIVDNGTLHFLVCDKVHGMLHAQSIAQGYWTDVMLRYSVNGDLLTKVQE